MSLMRKPTSLPSNKILADALKLNYFDGGDGVMMAQRQSTIIPLEIHYVYEWLSKAINEIAELTGKVAQHFLVNKLPPYCHVDIHTDSLVLNVEVGKIVVERWHLPLKTNPLAMYWDEVNCGIRKSDGQLLGVHMEMGYWFGPIPYYKKHCIWNDSSEERVHLVVDLIQ